MARQRLSWIEEARRASAHPATPDEGPASPAGNGEDPTADAYENGDTSSWASDPHPHPGPYPDSAHPATPDEGSDHPAGKSASDEISPETNRRASQCVRIATAMLGEPDSPAKVAAIEAQAIELMHLPDASITASLKRLGLDGDGEDDTDKEASSKISKNTDRIARLERVLIRLADDDLDEEAATKKASAELETRVARLERILVKLAEEDEDDDGDRIARLERVLIRLAEEEEEEDPAPKAAATDKKADDLLLEEMLREEGMLDEPCGMGEPSMDEPSGDTELEIDLAEEDPMTILADDDLDEEAATVLASLYSETPGANREAATEPERRPQPKKASTGASSLGNVRTASNDSDVAQLENLWKSAPDVSALI